MLNKRIQDELNKQINEELASAYIYLSMAAYFESKNLKGMANWMRVQTKEERDHAMKFFEFIHERGGRVQLADISAPKTDWKSPLAAFEDAHKHEIHITGRINGLLELARKEKDSAAEIFLHWFVTEQVEEEANATEIVEKLKMIGDSSGGLLYLDKELGKRGKKD
ncbi:MAG TPA: ferritin [Elusimicrobiota bacterium]|nr:ferritin [Elusimicrobiota bacterium]